MDIATIIGFLLAFGGIVFAMYHGTEGEFGVFYSTEGFVLVMGGAIGLAIMSMPFHAAKGMPALHKEMSVPQGCARVALDHADRAVCGNCAARWGAGAGEFGEDVGGPDPEEGVAAGDRRGGPGGD